MGGLVEKLCGVIVVWIGAAWIGVGLVGVVFGLSGRTQMIAAIIGIYAIFTGFALILYEPPES